MKLPSLMMLSSAICQIILGGTLGLGLGPIPQFGMRGVAAGSLIAYLDQHVDHGAGICFPAAPASCRRSGACASSAAMFFDILKVGAISCFSPLQSVLTDHHLHPHAGAVSAPRSWPATASARGSNSC